MTIRTTKPTKVPGLPKAPADISPGLRRYLESLSEAVEIRLGRRGDTRDRAVTLRELIDSGLAKELINRPFDPNGGSNFSGDTEVVDTTIPPAPTGFTVTGGYSVMLLFWDAPYNQYSNHSLTEVWRHDSDVLGDAQLVGASSGFSFSDPCGEGQSFYYWVRHVNTDGIIGPYNSTAGTLGETALDVVNTLEVLQGSITEDAFYQGLNDRIDLIEVNEANLAAAEADIAAAQLLINAAENDIVSLETITATHTSQITNLNTTVGSNSSNITTLQQTTATNASDITALETTVNNPTTGVAATASGLSSLSTTVTQQGNDITSNANDITALETTVNDPSTGVAATASGLSSLSTTVTQQGNDITSNASDVTALESTVNDPSTGVNATATAVNQLTTSVSNLDGDVQTLSSDVSQVNTTVGNLSTTVQTNSTSINGIEGEYSVKIDANGVVAGLGLINGPLSSSFYVRADTFAVGNTTSSSEIPFIIRTTTSTLNGVSVPAGVYIKDGFIQNGTITTARIGLLAVDTAQMADLAVTEGKIDSLAVTNAKIANAAITTAKIDNAQITTAKIGNAQVETLKIAGENITVPRAVSAGSGVSIGSSWTQIGSITVNWGSDPSLLPSQVQFFGQLNIIATVTGTNEVTRGLRISSGTQDGIVGQTSLQGFSDCMSAGFVHTPSTGSTTYRIYGSSTGSGATGGNWFISLLGVKR